MKNIYVPISLKTSTYFLTLTFQILFIVSDIVINEVVQWSDAVRPTNVILLMVYCTQDVIIIFAAMLLGHTMFRTHVFKAGFVRILLHRFRFSIFFTLLYLAVTIAIQVVTLAYRWNSPMDHVWPTGYTFLYVLHRCVAIFYYYFYKRAALRLSDARYYDEEWVKHSFAH